MNADGEPAQERRSTADERRRRGDRRKATAGRRDGERAMLGDRRTRFSIFYFIAVLVALVGLNYMITRSDTRQIAYSELKARIAAGEVASVVLAGDVMRAEIVDTLQGVDGRPDQ
jgi:hypothetical protein